MGGVKISIILPNGVTPAVLSGNDATGSAVASGNAVTGSLTASSYDATTRTFISGIANPAGFASGEFMTITCAIATGTTVTAANFQSQSTVIEFFDQNANPISGATCPIGVTFQ